MNSIFNKFSRTMKQDTKKRKKLFSISIAKDPKKRLFDLNEGSFIEIKLP